MNPNQFPQHPLNSLHTETQHNSLHTSNLSLRSSLSPGTNPVKGPGERESPGAHNGASVLKGGALSRSRGVINRSEEGSLSPLDPSHLYSWPPS